MSDINASSVESKDEGADIMRCTCDSQVVAVQAVVGEEDDAYLSWCGVKLHYHSAKTLGVSGNRPLARPSL